MRGLVLIGLASAVRGALVVNEIATKGNALDVCNDEDWVELYNPGPSDEDLAGLILVDDKGFGDEDELVLGQGACPTTLEAGYYLVFCKDGDANKVDPSGTSTPFAGCGQGFGFGQDDIAQLFDSGGTLISSSTIASPETDSDSSWSRASVDGTGDFVKTPLRTPGAKNMFLLINEIATSGNDTDPCLGEDWVELFNPTENTISLVGLQMSDANGIPDDKQLNMGAAGCPTELAAGQFLLLCGDETDAVVTTSYPDPATTVYSGCGIDFGLSGSDEANLYDAAGNLIDTTGAAPGAQSETVTWGRDGANGGDFYLMPNTPLAENDGPPTDQPPPPPPPTYLVGGPSLRINEVADKGDDYDLCEGEDYIELFNYGDEEVSIEGLVLVDDKGHGDEDQLTLGAGHCPSALGAGAYLVLCKENHAYVTAGAGATPEKYGNSSDPCGFFFGVGSDDTVMLFANASHELYIDATDGCCANSELLSFGVASIDATASAGDVMPVRTPGLPNIWTIMVNEVANEGNADDMCAGEDWIELWNPLMVTAVDLTTLVVVDDKGHGDEDQLSLGQGGCPASLAPESYLVLCKEGAAYVVNSTAAIAYEGCGMDFGLGGGDRVLLYETASGSAVLIDDSGEIDAAAKSAVASWGRARPDKPFEVMVRTPGAVNIDSSTVAPPPPSPSLPPAEFPPLVASAVVINEVAATGNADDVCAGEDWIELWNPTAASASIVDYVLVDDDGHGHEDRLVLGAADCPQAVGAGEYLLFCKEGAAIAYNHGVATETFPGCGMEFGVGGDDTINLFTDKLDNTSLADTTPYCCFPSGVTSFGRTTHDGTGAFYITERTPGLPNFVAPPPAKPPPSPPPPPTPPVLPGAAVVTVHKVEAVVVAAGTVDDYGEPEVAALAVRMAAVAGVDASDVEVTVASASVRITVLITAASATAATSIQSTIDATLDSPSAASAALDIAVEQAVTTTLIEDRVTLSAPPSPAPSPPPQSPSPADPPTDDGSSSSSGEDGLSDGAVAGIVVGIVILVLGVAGAIAFYMKKEAFVTHAPAAKMGKATPMEMRPKSAEEHSSMEMSMQA